MNIIDIFLLFFYIMAYVGIISMVSWLCLCGVYHLKTYNFGNKNVSEPFVLNEFPLVTIVVPVYNEEKIIDKKIRSLLDIEYPELEILVVNDGSIDNTYEIVRNLEGIHTAPIVLNGYDKKIKNIVIRIICKKNGGKSSALNTGLKVAKGDIIVVSDADVIIEPSAICALVKHFENKDTSAVSGRTKIPRINWLTNCVFHEVNIAQQIRRPVLILLDSIHLAIGPLSAFRKSALEKIGGYREDVVAEDYELTLRLIKTGYRVEFEINAIGRPMRPTQTMKGLVMQRRRWYKGILDTIIIHRDMLFNRKYRWIGCYFMPMTFVKLVMMFVYLVPSLLLMGMIAESLIAIFFNVAIGLPVYIGTSNVLWALISIWMVLMLIMPLTAIILGNIKDISSIIYIPLSLTIYKLLLTVAWIYAISDVLRKKGYVWYRGA